jgi:membrane protein
MAALVAYYGFLSVFPLLMVFVTVLGMVLRGNASLQQSIVNSALAKFPVVGTQISRNVHSLRGSGVALVIGIAVSLSARRYTDQRGDGRADEGDGLENR